MTQFPRRTQKKHITTVTIPKKNLSIPVVTKKSALMALLFVMARTSRSATMEPGFYSTVLQELSATLLERELYSATTHRTKKRGLLPFSQSLAIRLTLSSRLLIAQPILLPLRALRLTLQLQTLKKTTLSGRRASSWTTE